MTALAMEARNIREHYGTMQVCMGTSLFKSTCSKPIMSWPCEWLHVNCWDHWAWGIAHCLKQAQAFKQPRQQQFSKEGRSFYGSHGHLGQPTQIHLIAMPGYNNNYAARESVLSSWLPWSWQPTTVQQGPVRRQLCPTGAASMLLCLTLSKLQMAWLETI